MDKQMLERTGAGLKPMVDPASGKVTLFDLATKKAFEVWPVDASEAIVSGTAVVQVELVGPAGRVTVNPREAEIKLKRDDGYQLLSEARQQQPPKPEQPEKTGKDDGHGDSNPPDLYEMFESHTVVDLKRFAALAKIKGYQTMNKAELVKTLAESGYQPEKTDKDN